MRRRPSLPGLSVVFALCANIPLTAQTLESIGKEKSISLSWGISFNQIFYSASGIESRRDLNSYFAFSNVILSLYGWSIPLGFNLSKQNTSFSQPFNQYPGLAITRSFMKRKIRTSLSSSFNKTYSDGINTNEIINCRGNATLAVRKKHNVNFNAVMVKRMSEREGKTRSFTECTVMLGYSYSFGTK